MSQQAIDQITRAITGFDQRVQAAADSSFANMSPCEGWTARDVVGHVTNNLRNATAGLTGGSATDVSSDEDIRVAWNGAREALLAAASTADLSVNIDGPFGPMPAEQFLGRIIATDLLVHTWDLARSIGADEALPVDLVEGAYSGLKPMDAMLRRPGVFSAKVEPPAGADMQTEFLCFLGRNV